METNNNKKSHRMRNYNLTHTMLNLQVPRFKGLKTVDPDQLASEKPANQDLQCFPICLFIYTYHWNPQS